MANLCPFPVWPSTYTHSGTTAVVALYREDRVWVANAGDSRAVLGTESRERLLEGTVEARASMVIASISLHLTAVSDVATHPGDDILGLRCGILVKGVKYRTLEFLRNISA